jgi:hypothetical protein
MPTKPFKDVNHGQVNKLASRRWVARFISLVLGKLNLTGQGIKITPTGDGHLHFEVEDSGASDHPFKVTVRSGLATIEPGLVYSANFEQVNGVATIQHVPVIGTTPLNAATAPTISVGTSGTRYVCLKARFSPEGIGFPPWKIEVFSNTPIDQAIVRASQGSNVQPVEGVYHVLIATIQDGAVQQQWARNNILVNLLWNDILVWS